MSDVLQEYMAEIERQQELIDELGSRLGNAQADADAAVRYAVVERDERIAELEASLETKDAELARVRSARNGFAADADEAHQEQSESRAELAALVEACRKHIEHGHIDKFNHEIGAHALSLALKDVSPRVNEIMATLRAWERVREMADAPHSLACDGDHSGDCPVTWWSISQRMDAILAEEAGR